MKIRILTLILFLVVNVNAGWWLTIPSANSGCGSLISDSYYWDTQDTYSEGVWIFKVTFKNNNQWSGTIPKGVYNENIQQYFCTGNIDAVPVGSYCFYQNRQNCNFY